MIIIAEYIWLNKAQKICSQSKIMNINIDIKDKSKKQEIKQSDIIKNLLNIKLYPNWNYTENDSNNVTLRPIKTYINPFLKAPNMIILCDTWNQDESPCDFNDRQTLQLILRKNVDNNNLSIAEENIIVNNEDNYQNNEPESNLNYQVGNDYCNGREIIEKVIQLAIEIGIPIYSYQSLQYRGSWSIMIGPCRDIDLSDNIIVFRYLVNRLTELVNTKFSYISEKHTNKIYKIHFEKLNITDLLLKLDTLKKNYKENNIKVNDSDLYIENDNFINKINYIIDRSDKLNKNPYQIFNSLLSNIN